MSEPGRTLSCARCGSPAVRTVLDPPVKEWERSDSNDNFVARHVFKRQCNGCGHIWTETLEEAARRAGAA